MTQRLRRSFSAIAICLVLMLVLSSCQNTEQKTQQTNPKPTSLPQSVPLPPELEQSLYTENIEEFKSKKYNQRLEGLVGCWLMSKEYLDVHKSNYLFFKDLKLKEIVSLKLVKECMKKVTRKDAILKITQLVGKNLQPAKKYEDIVQKSIVDGIFTEVSSLTIANYNQYQPINQEEIVIDSQAQIGSESLKISTDGQQIKKTATQNNENQSTQTESIQKVEISGKSLTKMSQFDLFLVDLIHKYNQEFQKLVTSKQGLKGRVEEELKKRQKYYFGFIPASSFSHSVFLVTISLLMVFFCTCFKYYKIRSKQRAQQRINNSEECDENCKSHAHSHVKDIKKLSMAKMTQLTMKKKLR